MSGISNIAVTLGEYLFEFTTHQQWINKATSWFRNCGHRHEDTICVDAHGRICRIGLQFMRADRDGTYPIKVYKMTTEQEPT